MQTRALDTTRKRAGESFLKFVNVNLDANTHVYLRMATKNIAIREDVYKKLLEARGKDESFSDAIE